MSEKSFTVIFIAITIVAVIGIIATRLISSNNTTPAPSAATQPQPTQKTTSFLINLIRSCNIRLF